jgi:uncharacterized protein (DUF1501 family)
MTRSSLNRRALLQAAVAGGLVASLPRFGFAATGGEARFVLVQLRGALDGLSAVPPVGDPDYARIRGPLAIAPPGAADGAFALDRLFGLHPALRFCAARWTAGELLACHAIATPYRERSHFDGQNVLESGGHEPSGSATGWLNRAIAALPEARAAARAGGRDAATPRGLALGQNVPLVLRGPAPVTSWAPSRLPEVDGDLLERLRELYSADALLSARLSQATTTGVLAEGGSAATAGDGDPSRKSGAALARLRTISATAGRMLAAPEGPRVAVIDASGWDTHAGEGGAQGQLAQRLRGLDEGLQALQQGLGEAWSHTVVAVVTEFGRTVAINGTRGTDHGTGAAALLVGGAVRGGRVLADWPGLAPAALHEGRDLRPTASLHAVFKGVLRDHLGLDSRALDAAFPLSAAVRPTEGLVRAPG